MIIYWYIIWSRKFARTEQTARACTIWFLNAICGGVFHLLLFLFVLFHLYDLRLLYVCYMSIVRLGFFLYMHTFPLSFQFSHIFLLLLFEWAKTSLLYLYVQNMYIQSIDRCSIAFALIASNQISQEKKRKTVAHEHDS